MKFDWENIYRNETTIAIKVTNRVKVFGGWLVQEILNVNDNVSTSMVFLPDPHHEWTIDE